MVTHDLDSLRTICSRIVAIDKGRVVADGTLDTMLTSEASWVKAYFGGARGRIAFGT
ncbi:hypothetical protein GCM10007874_15480 [Labrys miyagiensis]|uniref:Uncharacterized protein n=1 Tax=Labrys miyagiensis TaxID=346912 RepID=A0ABQ6CJZ0_9HYPH|nr:hypothetical protein GCM10007874_15480 [Labrys miyagiensis]